MKNQKVMRAYIYSSPYGNGDFFCSLSLEDGTRLYNHICSGESFAYNDLWGNRKDRQDLFKRKGIELLVDSTIKPVSLMPENVFNRFNDREASEAFFKWLESLSDSVQAEDSSALRVQEGGSHYKAMAIQPVEYIFKNNLGFIEGCVIKYVSRYKNKNGLEDLKKAKHFINLLIEMAYQKEV